MSERMRRVNEAMRQVLSEAVPTLKDPRIGFVTVTGVETTTDLERATVWVSVLGSEKGPAGTLEALTGAAESSRHASTGSCAYAGPCSSRLPTIRRSSVASG